MELTSPLHLSALLNAAAPAAWLAIAATFAVAGMVKGVSGLGLPTVALGLLGLFMHPGEAAALLIVPSLVTNVWQLLAGRHLLPLAGRLWPMLAGICGGTWLGGWLLSGKDLSWAGNALGIALISYALTGLSALKLSIPQRRERLLSPLVGLLTGCVTAMTGVFVIPAVPYLQAMDLDKEDLVQSMGLAFTCSTIALATNLACAGDFQATAAASSFLAVIPALVGMALGQWIRGRISLATFRKFFFSSLFLLGAHLALRSWW
ncbi:MAG TPA: sulfite exporter TauE/SafE family protein [Janthinobacterium sp.]|nr:sulfite exporter TauE/SafE family protein [Janthinobacterium sp.]